ncbi:MAG: hypothetical protein K9N46_05410 [Candidatus Marinimicrobia bacterium]|nr:hypothetical protein [Candidatus Neomarinimicrobiota bacterium]MCF7880160.1 hypothetical protein [Candidatus Neomarinimicrobiota bacterium]
MTETAIQPTRQLPPHEEAQVIEVSLREVLIGGTLLSLSILVIGGGLIGYVHTQKRKNVRQWFDRIERLVGTVLLESPTGKEVKSGSITIADEQ